MGMKVLGWVKCPFCDEDARFGIDREGQGRTVRIVCLYCWAQVQLPRDGEHAAELESRARDSHGFRNWATSGVSSLAHN